MKLQAHTGCHFRSRERENPANGQTNSSVTGIAATHALALLPPTQHDVPTNTTHKTQSISQCKETSTRAALQEHTNTERTSQNISV